MSGDTSAEMAVVGMACRVPGANDLDAFDRLLFEGRTGYGELPQDRCDRSLYFDPRKGQTGKTYSTLGGVVPELASHECVCEFPSDACDRFDITHRQFAEVAARAWAQSGLVTDESRLKCTGVFVGHSGGTQSGGPLSLGCQIEEALTFLNDVPGFSRLQSRTKLNVMAEVSRTIRNRRPRRTAELSPRFHAYEAAALAAACLKLKGRRVVIDAACASSLSALSQAMQSIRSGQLDSAIVGGATYNNVDNLILFSHSQACTDVDSRPFDDNASGLVSSEGYVAIVIMPLLRAQEMGLTVHGIIRAAGLASDGRGRSLWAPRKEGQMLALQRAYSENIPLLEIDYQEAHATSTQLGDATELETLQSLMDLNCPAALSPTQKRRLLIGSAKSNIGHTLEAAGLIGLVKVLLSMRRGQIPPSLRFQTPNSTFAWSKSSLEVVNEVSDWPQSETRRSRRAAVSAFGIGGLNAHVIVDDATVNSKLSGNRPPAFPISLEGDKESSVFSNRIVADRIVIVGRGVVLPGAKNVAEFARLMKSGHSAIIDAPEDRWRTRTGVSEHILPDSPKVPHCRGGYIRDFQFDGTLYRIPPKQVQQANPVQMMLIDAVSQALAELACRDSSNSESKWFQNLKEIDGAWPVDRQRVAVVMGTVFGGEFGDQLQVGMRLPEISAVLADSLRSQEVPEDEIPSMLVEFRRLVLQNRPALLDETGSFTASTMASRIAKTFDLMGGACALDSDDASGLAALTTAADQLNSGSVDMVVCGAAQRSMNLCAFEGLELNGRLVQSGDPSDVPDDCRQILPGEGVLTLLLCRESTARERGFTIFGILDETGQEVAETPAVPSASIEIAPELSRRDAEIVRKIGYLSGAHSLVRIVSESLQPDQNSQPVRIAARTNDGIVISTRFQASESMTLESSDPPSPKLTAPIIRAPRIIAGRQSRNNSSGLLRFAGTSREGLLRVLKWCRQELVADPLFSTSSILRDSGNANPSNFSPDDRFRAVLVQGQLDPGGQVDLVLKALESGRDKAILEREQAVIWATDEAQPRIAWLFPGQGSHYAGTPAVFSENTVAAGVLTEIDELYQSHGLPLLSGVFKDARIQPSEDIWWAQGWVLGVTAALSSAMRDAGLKPDCVLGHSFGEFSAAFATGVVTLKDLVELARHRSNSVLSRLEITGGLLSVRASANEAEMIIRSAGLAVHVSHWNSPRQTVIAGSRDAITAAQRVFDQHNVASVPVPVPAPFHTPFLKGAEELFGRLAATVSMKAPVCGFLSATRVQYLAEPEHIRDSLVRQLTQPVLFLPAIQRLVNDGCRLLIEVGPNEVLTKLARDTIGKHALCLSMDVLGKSFQQRMSLVNAATECVTGRRRDPWLSSAKLQIQPNQAVAVFDVTRRTRQATRPAFEPRDVESPNAIESRAVLPRSDVRELKLDSLPAPIDPPKELRESAMSETQLRGYLLDLVIELTGYAPDVVDFEAEMEADLGIDSIKIAQIFGELGSWLGLSVRPEMSRVGSVRTLEDVLQLALTLHRESVPADDGAMAVSSVAVGSEVSVSQVEQLVSVKTVLPDQEQLDQLLIDYVVDQTGYAREIVDVEADLEADLGLDSIKLAQLIGEIRSQFQLESLTLSSIAQTRFRTLRDIREFLFQHVGSAEENPAPVATSRLNSNLAPSPRTTATAHITDVVRAGSIAAVPWAVAAALTTRSQPSAIDVPGDVDGIIRGYPVDENPSLFLKSFAKEFDAALSSGNSLKFAQEFGREHSKEIRALLRSRISRPEISSQIHNNHTVSAKTPMLTEDVIRSLANGAGVSTLSVRSLWHPSATRTRPESTSTKSSKTSVALVERSGATTGSGRAASEVTRRFSLRVVPAPQRSGTPALPTLHGPALILGNNAVAEALADRIRSMGKKAHVLSTDTSMGSIEKELEELWTAGITPHLFLTMSCDGTAVATAKFSSWTERRAAAVEVPFRVCQLWMQRTIDSGLMEYASVIAVTRLGGDFGFSGKAVESIESVGGLVKAMLIEAWMRGFRTTPMKVIDLHSSLTLDDAVEGVLKELAVPSYDMEIALGVPRDTNGTATGPVERCCVQASPAPLSPAALLQPGHGVQQRGHWVVTGGGRGITAVIAMELACRHQLRLELLGTAPHPALEETFVDRVTTDRAAVRREIMQQATARGESPVEAWRNVEKAIEIDATLRQCRKRGISACYHCCDVTDADEVQSTLNRIRTTSGPIHGVIHGAGFGQDARFDRKRPSKVQQCLRAKIDGSLTLMEATQNDPLEWFVAFGSISGRFGANGHTDYSQANDMMAKIIDRYRQERPEVRSVTFHWHAWGDIGMATKPEAKLALEMIDMKFMPAAEGIAHFLHELESGGDEPEVLITDESYFRKFFPADRLHTDGSDAEHRLNDTLPLLPMPVTQHPEGICTSVVTLNPISDKFLSQHQVQGRPTLPFVVALELMAEAVRARIGVSFPGLCLKARAAQAIRFATDDSLAVTVQSRIATDGRLECRLLADVRRRDGRMVEEDREFFRAVFDPHTTMQAGSTAFTIPQGLTWRRIEYSLPDSLIYHGPELQELREVADDGQFVWGRIAASAPVQLFGGSRAHGFTVPCATMDACLYAIGAAAWHRHQRASLPVSFERIEWGRLPDPGEPCLVRVAEVDSNESGAVWDFQLQGNNGDRLLTINGYRVGWLKD
jgi:acyl transferase domain-containing protein/acyl carrier protein/NAD(P)-dependent dehydrogenase (short-subunit alcohol dehydrogenase family)